VEIQKQDFHFPIAVSLHLTNSKKEDSPERRVPVVQAHRSIRKCLASVRK
jgi:hypothetical protein